MPKMAAPAPRDFPAGESASLPAAAADPQVAARNMIVTIPDPKIGELRVAGNPIKLSGVAEPERHSPPPEIDADRKAILKLIAERA